MPRVQHCSSAACALLVACHSVAAPVLSTGLQAQQDSSRALEVTASPTTIRVHGATLTYRDIGEGEPVVFVHGSLGDLDTFKPQFQAFAGSYRLLAYSRRFHPPNPSPPGDSAYSALTHAEDLVDLMSELSLDHARVVGLSYGAYTALLAALKYPARIQALVLAEPPLLPLLRTVPGGDSMAEAWERQVLRPSQRAFGRGDNDEGLRLFVGGLRGTTTFDQLPASTKAHLREYIPALRLQMLTDMKLYFPPVTCEQLRSLQVPVLLVGGERSPPMFAVILAELARCLPDAHRVVIPNAGHNMQIDNPAAFNREVLGFLQNR